MFKVVKKLFELIAIQALKRFICVKTDTWINPYCQTLIKVVKFQEQSLLTQFQIDCFILLCYKATEDEEY